MLNLRLLPFLALFISLCYPTPFLAQAYSDYLGAGHAQGITVETSSQSDTVSGSVTVDGRGIRPDYYAASRFLSQASFGANYEELEQVANQGYEAWIDDQFGRPLGSYLDTTVMIWEHFKQAYIAQFGLANVQNVVFPLFVYWRMAWWHHTMRGQDPLRQRIALALSEIMVISEKSELSNSAFALASYYDVLYRNAFGNYRDLLYEVTMHPAMGFYLDHINNPKSNPQLNTRPDENYAREVMQLFSIGLYDLNMDGSRKQDAQGRDIPSYDNDDIKEYAKIFTGLGPGQYYWPWTDVSAVPVVWGNNFNYNPNTINFSQPMQMFDQWHEAGPKYLLNGQTVPGGQSGMQDLNAAVDNLYNHPNVGPFLGRLLIQRLVKSNPSPAYISRVAAVFNDNGQGVRGDLKSVVKAILLDPEARDCVWFDDPSSGKLREPLVRAIHLFKGFDLANASGQYWNLGFGLEEYIEQHVLASPSVFNFYLPDFQPNGPIADSNMVAPEFQIHNSRTGVDYFNYMYFSLLADYYMDISTQASTTQPGLPDFDNVLPADQVGLDLSDEIEAVNLDALALIDRLDMIMAGGSLSESSKQIMANTLMPFVNDPPVAVKVGIYLLVLSPDYNIQK